MGSSTVNEWKLAGCVDRLGKRCVGIVYKVLAERFCAVHSTGWKILKCITSF